MKATRQQLWKSVRGRESRTLTWMVWLLLCFQGLSGLARDDGKTEENKDGDLGAMGWKNVHRIDSALVALENPSRPVEEGFLRLLPVRQIEPIPAFPRLDPAPPMTRPVYFPDEKSPAGLPVPGMLPEGLSKNVVACGERMLIRSGGFRHPSSGNRAGKSMAFGTEGPVMELADRLAEAWAAGGMSGRSDPEVLQAALRRIQEFKKTYKYCQTDLMDPGMPGRNSLSGLKPGQRLLAGARFDAGWGTPRIVEIHPNLLYRIHAGLTAGVSLMIGFPVVSASRQNLRFGSGVLLQQVVWKGFFLSGEMLIGWPGRSDQPQGTEERSRIGFQAGLGREFSHNDRLRSQLLLSYDFSRREFAESPLRFGMGFGFPLRRP